MSAHAAMRECEEATGLAKMSAEYAQVTNPTEAEYRHVVLDCADELGIAVDPQATTDDLYAAAYRGDEPRYVECIFTRFGDIARRNLRQR